jgi:hypothetical protein
MNGQQKVLSKILKLGKVEGFSFWMDATKFPKSGGHILRNNYLNLL